MRRVLTVLLVVVGAAALLAVCVGVFYLYQLTRDLPSVDALKNYNPPVTTRVYAGAIPASIPPASRAPR